MKYLLILAVLGSAGAFYFIYQDNQSRVVSFQQEEELSEQKAVAPPAPPPTPVAPYVAPSGAADVPAIDAARSAAVATSAGATMGTVTTTDGHAYTNCKVIKWNDDGATFSCDSGIMEIPYWKMPPDLQKQFGYSIEKAAAQAAAQVRYQDQQAATQPSAATSSNP